MQTAFGFQGAGPASRPAVVGRRCDADDPLRAVRAPNARIAFVMQPIVRYAIFLDVSPNIVPAP